MLIFDDKRVLGVEHNKTNIEIPFDVPEGIGELIIEYSYSPKEPDEHTAVEAVKAGIMRYGKQLKDKDPYHYLPAKNLVTLSLDSPLGYRGAAHRQDEKQEHHISREFASPGFIAGDIEAGQWKLSLNAHCVMCPVTCILKITGVAEK